jgi:hypothetical protein
MSYNGWTNRETWLVNLWFNPESSEDVDYAKDTLEDAYNSLPDFMKDFVDIQSIDWDELRSHFEEDDEDEDQDEAA